MQKKYLLDMLSTRYVHTYLSKIFGKKTCIQTERETKRQKRSFENFMNIFCSNIEYFWNVYIFWKMTIL